MRSTTQLRGDRFNVEAGEGANVLVTSAGKTGFSLELVDSDVENVRVAVQSADAGGAAHRAEAGDAGKSADHNASDAAGTGRCRAAAERSHPATPHARKRASATDAPAIRAAGRHALRLRASA